MTQHNKYGKKKIENDKLNLNSNLISLPLKLAILNYTLKC